MNIFGRTKFQYQNEVELKAQIYTLQKKTNISELVNEENKLLMLRSGLQSNYLLDNPWKYRLVQLNTLLFFWNSLVDTKKYSILQTIP